MKGRAPGWSLLAMLGGLLLWSACEEDEPLPPPGTGGVQGEVEDVETGLPLPDVRMLNRRVTTEVSTLNDGAYEFADLDVGAHTITALLDGYYSVTRTAIVHADEWTTLDFTLEPEPAGEGTITGYVYDELARPEPTPIGGATITTDPPVATATSNAQGRFALSSLPAGTYTITATSTGFDPRVSGEFTLLDGAAEEVHLGLYESQVGIGDVRGRIIHSQTGEYVQTATILASDGSSTTSDENGEYLFGVDGGFVQLTATMDGFYESTRWAFVSPGATYEVNFPLTPQLDGNGDYRFVLSWESQPQDLDSYLLTPSIEGARYTVFHINPGDSLRAPWAVLNRDDTNGYGPETITIYRSCAGTYTCFVKMHSGAGTLAGSEAQVQVYDNSGLLHTVIAPEIGTGNYWVVCEIDGATGAISLVNRIQENMPEDGSMEIAEMNRAILGK